MESMFDTSLIQEQDKNPELRARCSHFNIDDPLSRELKGWGFLTLGTGRWLDKATTNTFDQLRANSDKEYLYSFFRLGSGLNAQIWKDLVPTEGKTWLQNKEIMHGVARYEGLPLDGEATRVMDIHNHPNGSPEAMSIEDSLFFLNDLDLQVQAVVSPKGTLIMAKPTDFDRSSFDEDEFNQQHREFHEKHAGDQNKRDKEFAIWTAKKYGLKLYWVKKGTNLLLPYH